MRKCGFSVAGVDAGALSTDAVVVCDGDIVGWSVIPTGPRPGEAAEQAYAEALDHAGLSRDAIAAVVGTGYGRGEIGFASRTVTEITCHAFGARRLFPQAATVIDVGGQDSKVIRLATDGRVDDFVMNDKCAAGTGRFLEVMAQALHMPVDRIGELAARGRTDRRISATCTVFAESEVVGMIGQGVPAEEIAAALHGAVAERIYGMVRRIHGSPPFVFSGGVAKNTGVVAALRERLGGEVLVPSEPQIVGALGAALLALRPLKEG